MHFLKTRCCRPFSTIVLCAFSDGTMLCCKWTGSKKKGPDYKKLAAKQKEKADACKHPHPRSHTRAHVHVRTHHTHARAHTQLTHTHARTHARGRFLSVKLRVFPQCRSFSSRRLCQSTSSARCLRSGVSTQATRRCLWLQLVLSV